MDELTILTNVEYYMSVLAKDIAKLEQGESPDLSCETAYYLKGLEQGLLYADPDELTKLMSDVCRYVYSPYDSFQMGGQRATLHFKSSIMGLYLIAQSIFKDLDDMEEEEERIDELFGSVFTHTQ